MTDTRYQQALDYIYSFIDYEKEPRPRDPVHYDLRRMDELLARLGNPHLKARTVHIAGSKGKGSVAAMISSVLITSGYTTGLFTSPHLHTFNERIRVNNRLISDDELVSLVERLKPEIEAVNEKATYGILTTFEVMTAIAFVYFEMQEVNVQVIEVGLGGRLDATNVVRPEVCVITSISFDHTEVLGNTLAEIATEKAGIIKPGSVVVASPHVEEVDRVVDEASRAVQAKLIRVDRDVTWQSAGFDNERQSFQIKGRLDSYELSIPMLGQHQLENATAAVAALEVLIERGFKISKVNVAEGLSQVKWSGRLQVLDRHPLLVVDGAHNPDSANKLRKTLEQYLTFDQAILIIGLSVDKDLVGIIKELAPLFPRAIATHSRHPRAMPEASIVIELKKHGIEAQAAEDMSSALSAAFALAGDRDLICVTGSLFVVAEAIENIGKFDSAV